jgi:diguanylate cyclase (GGDEF)-like protein
MSSGKVRHLAEKIRADLAGRSVSGAWAQPLSIVLTLLLSGMAQRAPFVSAVFLVLIAAASSGRLWLIRQRAAWGPAAGEKWEKLHACLLMFSTFVWGMLPAYSICAFGRYSQETAIVTLFHAGIAVGMMTVAVHDVTQINVALVLSLLPEAIAQVILGGSGFWKPIPAYLLYMGYLAITGKRLHMAYMQQISDNHDLAMLALHDNLTGLPNRRGMGDVLNRSIAEAQERGRQVAMFYVDFDGFKQINDVHSHRMGDLFLCEVAQRLSRCVEKRGVVARLGGDEFTAVITEGVTIETAKEMASDVLKIAREPLVIEGRQLACTVSIGVSLYPDDAQDADHLLRAADQAMYAAKTSGKNKVCFPDAIGGPSRDLQNLTSAFCR